MALDAVAWACHVFQTDITQPPRWRIPSPSLIRMPATSRNRRHMMRPLPSTEAGLCLHHAGSGPPLGHRSIAPALHVRVTRRIVPCMFSMAFGAIERAAQLRREAAPATVRTSSRPCRMLPDTPGASRCMRLARSLISRSASASSSSSHALRRVRRTLATCFFGQRSGYCGPCEPGSTGWACGLRHRLRPVEDEQTQHLRIPEFAHAVRLAIAAAL